MKFTFDQYAEQLRKDGHLVEDAVGFIRKTVKLYGPRYVQEEIQSATPRQPVDRATYKRSFRFDDIPGGAVAYNFAPYASVIELGRRPGARMPPLELILAWVKRKGIGRAIHGPVQPQYGPQQRGARRKSDRAHAVENQQHWIALQIARKIRARGLPAHHILKLAGERIAKRIAEDLVKALAEGRESRE